MNTIKCPKCGEVITVDESGYAEILNQVKNDEFTKELKQREDAIKLSYEKEMKSAIALAVANKEKEILAISSELTALKNESKTNTALEVAKIEKEMEAEKDNLKEQISTLKEKLAKADSDAKLQISEAINDKEQKILTLENEIAMKKTEYELNIKTLNEAHESKIKEINDQVAYYRDLKAKASTKMIGESLETHCSNMFNSIRAASYPNAYFEKDNTVSKDSGSKGDFIFRDYIDNQEYISIMFEMKNENETTSTKHKNEDFFKELDKDRNEKGCEYAILVSMLEADNDFYNAGIVDVSYKYPKMYVIRPQCFLAMITILTNAAKNSADYHRQLVELKNENIDITNFENELVDFQTKFSKNFTQARERFAKAIEEIDNTIKKLNIVKDSLIGSERALGYANDKAQDLSIKKLTRNNPTMKSMFAEIKKEDN